MSINIQRQTTYSDLPHHTQANTTWSTSSHRLNWSDPTRELWPTVDRNAHLILPCVTPRPMPHGGHRCSGQTGLTQLASLNPSRHPHIVTLKIAPHYTCNHSFIHPPQPFLNLSVVMVPNRGEKGVASEKGNICQVASNKDLEHGMATKCHGQ